MKKKITLLAALIAIVSLAALAQAPPPAGPQPGRDILVEFLGLTSAQMDQWRALHEEFRESNRPLLEQKRSLEEQLRAALQETAPDPTTVGSLLIQIDAIQDQLRAARENLENALVATLTAEQKIRYEAFRAAQAALRGAHQQGPGAGGGGRK